MQDFGLQGLGFSSFLVYVLLQGCMVSGGA